MKRKTKVLFTSDWHVDAMTAGIARESEIGKYVATLIAYVEREKVDVVCFCGDAFDPGSMREAQWSSFMFDALHRITHASQCGTVWIPGNHDVIDSTSAVSTLAPLAIAQMQYGEYWTPWKKRAAVCESPELVLFEQCDLAVLALPYVSRAVMNDPSYAYGFDTVLDAAREHKQSGKPAIAIGHYALPGIVPGDEEEMMRGREIPIPSAALLPLDLDLVVNGHYHQRQTVSCNGLRVEVVGSPARFRFGEADVERGFLVVEI
jgi:DNA repair exonuclease SbcCD nuclease subunit